MGFDWYPTICRFVRQTKLYTKTVTIVRDAESTGMGNACYLSLDGINRYDKMPKAVFLQEAKDGMGKCVGEGIMLIYLIDLEDTWNIFSSDSPTKVKQIEIVCPVCPYFS